jgi:hypothetical protein
MGKGLRLGRRRFVLPGVHLAACVVALVTSLSTPGGTWYVLIPFDPVLWPFMFSPMKDLSLFALFATLGTVQWYLISRVIEMLMAQVRRLLT